MIFPLRTEQPGGCPSGSGIVGDPGIGTGRQFCPYFVDPAHGRTLRWRKVLSPTPPGASVLQIEDYEMLTEARRRALGGADVVVGLVETHGRAETAARVAGLSQSDAGGVRPGHRPQWRAIPKDMPPRSTSSGRAIVRPRLVRLLTGCWGHEDQESDCFGAGDGHQPERPEPCRCIEALKLLMTAEQARNQRQSPNSAPIDTEGRQGRGHCVDCH